MASNPKRMLFYLVSTILCLSMPLATKANAADDTTIKTTLTAEEKIAFAFGLIEGADIAAIGHGEKPISVETRLALVNNFLRAAQSCTTIDCIHHITGNMKTYLITTQEK